MNYDFYKKNDTDKVFWVDSTDKKGTFLFSFDQRIIFNLFVDYPHNLTPEQKAFFDAENPFWKSYFKTR